MKKTSRKFLLDVRISTQFNYLCDSLGLKKDAWACFFIQFEMDFLSENRGMGANTNASLKYLERLRSDSDKKEYSIKMPQVFVNRIDRHCHFFKITRVMLVEFALKNACTRINLDTKLSTQRSDLLPLFLLENSFNNRIKAVPRLKHVQECLVIGKMK